MPEHSETTPTPSTVIRMPRSTPQDSMENGLRIAVESAESLRLHSATWIVTTTTERGALVDWRVQVTRDVTL